MTCQFLGLAQPWRRNRQHRLQVRNSIPPGATTTEAYLAPSLPTPLITINTATATLALSGTLPTSVPVGSRPATYTLQAGEFVFCIARRFDVDPDQVLSLNGLSDGRNCIPRRSLENSAEWKFPRHPRPAKPSSYLYSVLHQMKQFMVLPVTFGDVDPAAIAQANNISPAAALTVRTAIKHSLRIKS